MAKAQSERLALGADGELVDTVDEFDQASLETEPTYCNQCGTPNTPNAHFCRKCGYDLVAQDAAMIGVPSMREQGKLKNKLKSSNLSF